MSELNSTAVDKNNNNNDGDNKNRWEENVYIYKGGKINNDDRRRIEHVRIGEHISMIHRDAFDNCTNLQTVQFSTNGNLKKIGTKSFYNCTNLLSIDLQNTQIETMGDCAFCGCSRLATVQFPATIQKIGRGCFAECRQLKAIELSHVNHLESIEEYTFYSCSTLTMINLPPTMSCIGNESFRSCAALEAVDLRATRVDGIGEGAFYYCKNLTTISFPTTTKCIGYQSFRGCTKLAYLDLQSTNIERIEDRAFCACSDLKTINFPKTLKHIGGCSFAHCTKLEYVDLHETSIERIGNRAFYNCTNLMTVVGISTSHQEQNVQESMNDYGSTSMIFPTSHVDIDEGIFYVCPVLQNRIDTNWIHYQCDLNRGGRQFLQRGYHHHQQDNDSKAKRHGKVYFSSLWPLILHRVMNEMELPKQTICRNDDDLTLYANANPVQRRASVVYYMLVNGVVPDVQPQAQAS